MENSVEKPTELDLPHTCGEECDHNHIYHSVQGVSGFIGDGEPGPSGAIGIADGPGPIGPEGTNGENGRNGCDPGHPGELGPSGEIGMADGPGAIAEKQAEMTFKCGACGKDIGGKIEQMVEDIPVCQECFTKTHTPIKRMARKIGRNELCPCQSVNTKTGNRLKYKKCCISKIGQVG
jgi:hypothetical protein